MLANYSLRTRLLWLLLAAIALTAVAQALTAYHSARMEADEIFDYHMQQTALSLRSGLPFSGSGLFQNSAEGDEDHDFIVQVWTNSGLRIFESAANAALPQRAVMGFANVPARGTTYRVFSLQARDHVIQVAQDMAIRRQIAGAMALRTVLPVLLMAPLLMLVAWWSVSYSLRPLGQVREQLAQRRADDLEEINEAALPDELRPLVQDLNQLLRRLRGAFEAQRNFVGDAAHELRSPLSALKLQVQAIQRAQDDTMRHQAVTRLATGIDRATHVLEQLLALARQQVNAQHAAAPVVLRDVVRSVIGDLAPEAHTQGIDLGLNDATEDTISGHAEALRILVRNLLDNALKYTPRGGSVDVEICLHDQQLILRVDDSGPGIPNEELGRVLDRFYRGQTPGVAGSGLGLSIVKSIAELHRASVTLQASPTRGGLRVEVVFAALSTSAI